MGFCVAITMNGASTGCVNPSTVTRPSSMTSSSAAWVFGLARLISSASTTFANTGPAWNSNCPERWSKMLTPVMSPGSRSGVNWMRLLVPLTLCAIARASEVLPVPGKSSSSRWPSLNSAMNPRRTTTVFPSSTCSTPDTSRPNVSWKPLACSGVIVMSSSFAVGSVRGVCPVVCSRIALTVRGHPDHEIRVLVAEQSAADHFALRRGCRVIIDASRDRHRVVAWCAACGLCGRSSPHPVPRAECGRQQLRRAHLDRAQPDELHAHGPSERERRRPRGAAETHLRILFARLHLHRDVVAVLRAIGGEETDPRGARVLRAPRRAAHEPVLEPVGVGGTRSDRHRVEPEVPGSLAHPQRHGGVDAVHDAACR